MSNQAERRQMKMHPRLLWDVIHRQAGTLGKAILEGVMNSVDAGATFCDLTIDRETFSISDDGKGFASDEEISKFFETFGYPHEAGDAQYGRYRMGRGQIMSFGRSHWETNNYRMDVDFKPQQDQKGDDFALGYDFRKVGEKVKGCSVKVDLYDKLSPSQVDSVQREIADYVRYVHIPVRLNGKVISVDPAAENWDEETPDAYIKRKAGGTLDVYNQGVLVCKMSSYRHGVSGVVVSKEAIEVNFARNDIQSTCPRWKRIVRVLNEDTMAQVKRNTPLNDSQRDFFARQVATGEMSLEELNDSRIVTDVTGSHHPFSIFQRLDRFQNRLSVAPRGDRVAEMAHTRRMGFMVSDECAARFGADTPEELAEIVKEVFARAGRSGSFTARPVSRADFDKVISSSHEPVADKELNKAERMAIKAIREGAKVLYSHGRWHDHRTGGDTFRKGDDYGERRISVGLSDTAQAWTDGMRNIWIERRQLKKIKNGYRGMSMLSGLVLHEYLHNGPSTDTHDHGVEFYNRFHDMFLHTEIVSYATEAMMKTVLKELRSQDKAVSQQLTKFEDSAAEAADLGIGQYDPSATVNAPEPEEIAPEPEDMAASVGSGFVPDVSGLDSTADDPAPQQAADEGRRKAARRARRKAEDDGCQMTMPF